MPAARVRLITQFVLLNDVFSSGVVALVMRLLLQDITGANGSTIKLPWITVLRTYFFDILCRVSALYRTPLCRLPELTHCGQ